MMAVFEQKKLDKVTLDDTVPLTCSIENAQNVKDHTEYYIRVQRGPVPENSWTVTKRYSDFVALDAALRVSGYELPLPPKKMFGNMEREFIAERQTGLQEYLKNVLSHTLLASSIIVKKFLDPDNYSSNLQEVALQHISMFFRSEPKWEVVEPIPDVGTRLRKQYFVIKDKDQPKAKYILSWSNLGPDKFLPDRELSYIMKILPTFKHPNLYPVALCLSNETSGIAIRPFHEKGTLRDMICKAKPLQHHMKKYGKRKTVCGCQLTDIKLYGRQILETLRLLHEKDIPYGHLHAGNVIIEDGKCKFLDMENWFLGLPSCYRGYFTQFKKINTMEAIDVYCFGHLLYEMAFGEPLDAATCDTFPQDCSAQLRSVLESILTTEACKNGLPDVTALLLHPFFSDVPLRVTEKPQLKIPSKLKDSVKDVKTSVEKRLRREQKVISQYKRLSKAQAFHMSAEEKKKRRKSKKKKVPTATLR